MRKILVIFAIVLGLTGCSTPVTPEVELPIQSEIEESTQDETEESTQDEIEESTQNKVEWIITNTESRSASTTFETGTLEYVTLEVYKVTNKEGKFIQDEKELLETKKLYRGEVLTFPSSKDYDYKYITCIKIIEFDRYSAFYAKKNKITFFDYEGTIGMEISNFYNCQIDVSEYKGWKNFSDSVGFIDPVEGYTITYDFLDQSVVRKFYEEHKDGGRIVWNN